MACESGFQPLRDRQALCLHKSNTSQLPLQMLQRNRDPSWHAELPQGLICYKEYVIHTESSCKPIGH